MVALDSAGLMEAALSASEVVVFRFVGIAKSVPSPNPGGACRGHYPLVCHPESLPLISVARCTAAAATTGTGSEWVEWTCVYLVAAFTRINDG